MTDENNTNYKVKYQIEKSSLYIVGGKDAEKVIKNLKEKKRKELDDLFWAQSDHLD
ncbi:hypothetical protein KAI04_02685 [Candidatus Pacearchaeota archaeon]|nr:hypothetical protein [Candidatus Pacearchaeota archaeon]